MHFSLYGYWLCIHENSFQKKYLDRHSRGKSDKNGIFDVVKSCSIFDKYIFRRILSNVLLLKYKHIGCALWFVIYEFKVSKKCQVSLVVKYINEKKTAVHADCTYHPKIHVTSHHFIECSCLDCKINILNVYNIRPLPRCVPSKSFFYFSTKTYVVGTQKNHLIEISSKIYVKTDG